MLFEKKHQQRVEHLRTVPIYRDWSRGKAATDRGGFYPQHQGQTINVKRWSNDQVIEYVRKRLELQAMAKFQPLEDLPECTDDERWVRDKGFAVMKDTNKTATKLYKTQAEADESIRVHWLKKWPKSKFRVDERRGSAQRCELYCDVAPWCQQFAASDAEAFDKRLKKHNELELLLRKENSHVSE